MGQLNGGDQVGMVLSLCEVGFAVILSRSTQARAFPDLCQPVRLFGCSLQYRGLFG